MTSPERSLAAIRQSHAFQTRHRVPETERMVDGFRDGGRGLAFDNSGEPAGRPRREIIELAVHDPILTQEVDRARTLVAPLRDRLSRAEALCDLVGELMAVNDPARNRSLIAEIAGPNGPAGAILPLGRLIQARTGVCRHRSLLFKVLADETGVPSALVRGNYARRGVETQDGQAGARGGHAWNEVILESGERILVDSMHRLITDLSDPILESYSTVTDEPLYRTESECFGPVPLSVSEDADLIRRQVWTAARISTGGRAYCVATEPSQAFARLREALSREGLRHEVREVVPEGASPLEILLVTGASALRLRPADHADKGA